MASRAELERRLKKLEADMPELRRRFPKTGEFLEEFAGHADHITDNASAADVGWAFDQVDYLLAKHGFRTVTDDLPPDR
jgi:hypothetical protein